MYYRINKAISKMHSCSRRDADELVMSGKVLVNSQLVENFSTYVKFGDALTISGKKYTFNPTPTKLFALYKPNGCITSSFDPNGRATVFDFLHPKYKSLLKVGRLDYNTEGLLLFTNDGDFARFLESPSSMMERTYKVRVFGYLDSAKLQKMQNLCSRGIKIKEMQYMPAQLELENSAGKLTNGNFGFKKNYHFRITLQEGKNREVRNIFEYFGMEVNKLIRETFGPFRLGQMKQRDFIELEIGSRLADNFMDFINLDMTYPPTIKTIQADGDLKI